MQVGLALGHGIGDLKSGNVCAQSHPVPFQSQACQDCSSSSPLLGEGNLLAAISFLQMKPEAGGLEPISLRILPRVGRRTGQGVRDSDSMLRPVK